MSRILLDPQVLQIVSILVIVLFLLLAIGLGLVLYDRAGKKKVGERCSRRRMRLKP
jgi:hypothetical protein